MAKHKHLFEAGTTIITQNLHNAILQQHLKKQQGKKFHDWITSCLLRHCRGDWGDMEQEDKQMNEEALTTGARIFSAYTIPKEYLLDEETFGKEARSDEKIWVITEADRSATTLLFPADY